MSKYRSINRRLLEKQLKIVVGEMPTPDGTIIDIGAGKFHTSVPSIYPGIKDFVTADMKNDVHADIVWDFTRPPALCKTHDLCNKYNLALCLNIIEHIPDPEVFVNNVCEILTEHGTCIASTPFLYRVHAAPNDYNRQTADGLKYLFRRFSHVEVIPYGNRLSVIWMMISTGNLKILQKLNPVIERFDKASTDSPLGNIVVAKK